MRRSAVQARHRPSFSFPARPRMVTVRSSTFSLLHLPFPPPLVMHLPVPPTTDIPPPLFRFGLGHVLLRSSACGCVICRRDDHKPRILKSNACLSISSSLHCVYTSSIMPPKVTTEAVDDDPTVTGTTSTSSTGSGPGTLRQRFKLTVDDISKEVEELSVKLKRKVRYLFYYGMILMNRVMGTTRSARSRSTLRYS